MKRRKLSKSVLALLWLVPILAVACSTPTRLQIMTPTGINGSKTKSATSPEAVTTASPFVTTLGQPLEKLISTGTQVMPATPSRTNSSTPSPKPTKTPTPTITPTYAILRGEVLVRANCRYGPGAPYLYKYGLVAGSNLEIIGRTDSGTWILVRAIGGNNPCWVKASLMDVKGDVMAVQPTYIPLRVNASKFL